MAAKLKIDDGVKEFQVNGREALRFNPSDPNLYRRFADFAEGLPGLVEEFRRRAEGLEEDGGALLALMEELDRVVKGKLSAVFGGENDFDRILGGVNLLAVGSNGRRVVTNLVEALEPILEKGVKAHRQEAAAKAVAQARARRSRA